MHKKSGHMTKMATMPINNVLASFRKISRLREDSVPVINAIQYDFKRCPKLNKNGHEQISSSRTWLLERNIKTRTNAVGWLSLH